MSARIKICGLKDPDMARAIALAGADAIGLVFYPPSPRHVDLPAAEAITAALPAFVSSVGLFVDASVTEVKNVLARVPLDLLQFHGNESPDYCASFGRPYIKAVRVKPGLDLLEYAQRYASARGLLCDAYSPVAPGGTGERFDWRLLPADLPLPLILSGGLVAANVGDGIRATRPWAVDVSSGVERQRGEKDLNLARGFIDAVRAAAFLEHT